MPIWDVVPFLIQGYRAFASCSSDSRLVFRPKVKETHGETVNDNIESKNMVDMDDLFSARSVDYRGLRDALQSSEWREADRQTTIALLQFFGKVECDNLTADDIDQLHETDIQTIDNLWLRYSHGQFGFSIQKRIYIDAGGKPDCEYYWDAWNKFGVSVGWRERGKWKRLSEIVYDTSSPRGHLPVLESWWTGSNEKVGVGSDEGSKGRRLWRFLLSHKNLEAAPSDSEKKLPEISASQPSMLCDLSTYLHVFLCHSSGDKQPVRKLYERLKSDGVYPWLDNVNLLPGQEWRKEIKKEVRKTHVVIVCLSNESINKTGFVQKEIKLALDIADEQPEDTIFIIPLKLEECDLPQRLSQLQWVNLFENSGYQRLMFALRHRANGLGIVLKPDQGDSSVVVSRETPEQDSTLRITDLEGFNIVSEKPSSSVIKFSFLNLSRPNTNQFKGREAELIVLRKWFDDPSIRLIMIAAAGGYGKSMLASRIYEQALGFDDQFWVYFDQFYRFGQWGRWILAQLGQEFDERLHDEQLRVALVNCLSKRRFLLVLDNLETVLEDKLQWQPYELFLQALCNSSGVSKVLITSRIKPERLPLSSKEMNLKGLSEKAALDFLEIMKVQGTGADLRTFIKLTDCHPLLLKLTVEWLRKKRGKSANVAFILSQQDINLFEDIVGNHQNDPEVSIANVLEQSLNLLPSFLQQLWQDLSVYRQSFGLLQAKAMQPNTTEESLRELARYALLQEEPTEESWEFSFLSLLQKVAQNRTQNKAESHRRAISYFESVLQPKPWKSLEDIVGYLETVHHQFELQQYNKAFETILYCDDFLALTGYNITRLNLYNNLIKQWHLTSLNRAKVATCFSALGDASFRVGQSNESVKYHSKALNIYRQTNDIISEAISSNSLGDANFSLGNYPQAKSYYELALGISRKSDRQDIEANALGGLGNIFYTFDDFDGAKYFHGEQLKIFQKVNNQRGKADALGGLANVAYVQGKYEIMISLYTSYLAIVEELGDRRSVANAKGNLGLAYWRLGEYPKAIGYHQQQLDISKEINDVWGEAHSRANIGLAYHHQGKYEEAIDYYKKSLEIRHSVGELHGEADTMLWLANSLSQLNQKPEAIKYYKQACSLYNKLGLESDFQSCDKLINNLEAI
jgi:tetratricopeptide (TPR) repeat protein